LTRRSVTLGSPDRATPVLERHYAYGADDLLTEIRDLATGVHRFGLDRSGRVTSVTADGWTENYAYDALGNLTHAVTPVSEPEDATRDFTGTRLQRAGRTSYTHDAQGRVVRTTKRLLNGRRRIHTFTWNTYDQLVATVAPDGERWRYLYDAAGPPTCRTRPPGPTR
jgi:YD repeat-containing protein